MTDVPSPFDMHELLTAQDFVRRLARSLVFNQGRVDDVVQEAWAAAIQQPPRERAAAASWFRSVLQNLARRRSRDEARRRAREQAAARPEAMPSAADVLAREQQRREVVDAVMALPEPYRATVLARFFDELEPREIARRRGVPAATVRSQLHRALELLRQRLDERHGSRRAWGVLLVPLARPVRATGSGLLTAAGALLMAKVLFGAGALALAVLALLWLGDGAGAPSSAGGTQQAAATTEATGGGVQPPAGPPEERTEVPTRTPVAIATPATGAAGLRGRVVHADGRPAPGALVRVLGIDGVALFAHAPSTGDARTLPLSRGETRTGADGTFTVTGLAPRARYAVHADADGPDRTLLLAHVTPFPDETADLGDLVLAPKGSIQGRAIDSRGEPVAGAEVMTLDLPAALLAALPFDRFAPEHGGMVAMPVPDAAEAANPLGYRERLRSYLARELFERADLDRKSGLTTFVVDRMPWLETLWRELPIARTGPGADGTFTVRGVEPGANVVLVRKPGLDTGSKPRVVVQAGVPEKDIGDVRLLEGEQLRGRVQDSGGRPVAGAEVRLAAIGALGYRGVGFCQAPVTTGPDGSFAFTGLGRGRACVAARASAGEPWHVVGPMAVDEEVALRLPARSELRVRIARADGAPLTGLALDLFAGPHLHELRRAGLQQRLPVAGGPPDAQGTLSLGALPEGCYTLHVEAGGAMPAEVMLVLPQPEPATITLPAALPVLVRVRDAAAEPVAGARVYVTSDDPSTMAAMPAHYGLPYWHSLPHLAGATDATGELHLHAAAEGGWVHVTHPIHAPTSILVRDRTIDVTLRRPGTITGRLFDKGVPADPRRYAVVAEVGFIEAVPLPELRTGLQPDGTFVFRNVMPNCYYLRHELLTAGPLSLHRFADEVKQLVMPSYVFGEETINHRLEVEAGATASIEFDVDPNSPKPGEVPARLAGRALIDGVPLAGAQLQRRANHFRDATLATVGADGSFSVQAMPPGQQQLSLVHEGNQVWAGSLTLQGGAQHTLDLALRTGCLAGTARFSNGMSSAGHVVTATGTCNGGTVERTAALDAAGTFAFAALPAGDYTLTVRGPDGKGGPVRVPVAAGAAAGPIQLELQEQPVISGRVEGDLGTRWPLLMLRGGESMVGISPDKEGNFHFGNLEARVYTLEMHIGDKVFPLVPGTFDLRNGSQRGLRLRLGEPGK